ncbi:MAG TPA: hypothetical protein VII38_05850, partial [Polyangia bacterium]
RAQIEAAAKLEQARIEADARARMDAKKFPVGAVVGGVVALVVVVAIIMGVVISNHNRELAEKDAQARAIAAQADQQRKEDAAQQKALQDKLDALKGELDQAKTDEERAKIRAQMQAAAAAHAAPSHHASHHTAEKAAPKVHIDSKSNDPLGGLPGM